MLPYLLAAVAGFVVGALSMGYLWVQHYALTVRPYDLRDLHREAKG